MSGCKWFTQIDLSDAYLQIPVDKPTGKLLAINTTKGLFSFNRLCPGVRPAASVFQQTMETILGGIANVIIYFDDILIATPCLRSHVIVLKEVIKRLHDNNMRIRLEKCNFFKESVKYLGVIVDRNGQRPDPSKCAAITSMPPPESATQLKSYLGALTFYSRFIRAMASIRAPLNALLKKGIDYVWSKDCQTAFEEFKRILQSDLLLVHYDPRRPIVVAADACQSGIGGIGYHAREDGSIEAFMHVSRRLTPAETRYSQIEKEALALVWTIMRLHKYVYGRKFKLLTDHLPLLSIFGSKKGIPTHVANRIQRWAIKLMAYDFQIEHVKTDDFGHADVLSRLIAEQRQDNNEEMVIAEIKIDDLTIALVDAVLPVSFKEIVAATEEDQVLPIVMDYVRNGWPLAHKSTDIGPVSVFRRVKESLSLTRGALTYMDRTVIPPLLQKRVLAQLHKAHPGISRMTSVARAYVYWPGLDKCIKDLVNRCGQCQLAEKAPVKSLLSSWATPTAPWERVLDYYIHRV